MPEVAIHQCSSLAQPGWLTLRKALWPLLALSVCGCGGSGSLHVPDDTPVVFQFRMRRLPSENDFRATISTPQYKALARAQLALPDAQRKLHVHGNIGKTNGGYNLNWSWHFEGSVTLAEVSIELCDTTPAQIEANVDSWVAASSGACPWASYVFAELP